MSTNKEKQHAALVDLLNNFDNRTSAIVIQYKETEQALLNAQLATYFAEQEYNEVAKNSITKEAIIKKTIECKQAGHNVLNIITHLKECSNQTITQASVNAGHMARASHGILLITSDMGSMYSIMQASEFGSELFILTQDVFKKTEDIAMLSEKASQLAMEIAADTAGVAATALLDKATYSYSLLDSLLKKLNDSYQEAKAEWDTKADTLAENKNTEILAEGSLKKIIAVKEAVNETYAVTNTFLNQQLQVKVTGTDILISFNTIQAPFKEEKTEQVSTNILYPVKDYFLFFVKDSKKGLFDLNHAESIVANEKANQYIQINPKLAGKTIKTDKKLITCTINTGNLKYKDNDGAAIETNTHYVVFLMAVYEEKYQRYINQYGAYLSAPSLPFYIAPKLADTKKSKASDKLNSFIKEVQNTKEEIDLLEATVSDLSKKAVWMQHKQIRTRTYGNSILEYRNNLLQIIETVNDLMTNESILRLEVIAANKKINQLTKVVDELLKKLLFTMELVNKLSSTIIRKKALNPLISDDLLRSVSIIAENSSLAVDVSLLALQYTFNTLSASNELVAITKQTQLHLSTYYRLLADDKKKQMSLSYLINQEEKETQQQEQQLIKDLNQLQIQIEKTNQELAKVSIKYEHNELAQHATKQLS